MSWGYVAIGGAMVIGSAISADASQKSSQAAERSANAQLTESQLARHDMKALGQQNIDEAMKLAEASPQELHALDMSMQSADKALSREERMLAAIDPAILEAGKQALDILKGQTAETNKPMIELRNAQRQRIVNQLREQYGPGAETSSLGMKALRAFDLESQAMFAQNQQNVLGQLFSMGSTDVGGRYARGISTLQQVGQGYGAINERKLNTRINTGNQLIAAMGGSNAAVIQNAGAPYVGAAAAAQGQNAIGQNISNLAGIGLGAKMGAGNASPTTTNYPPSGGYEIPSGNLNYNSKYFGQM